MCARGIRCKLSPSSARHWRRTRATAEAWYQKGVVEARTLNFETALNDLQKASAASPKTDLALQIGQLRGEAAGALRQDGGGPGGVEGAAGLTPGR